MEFLYYSWYNRYMKIECLQCRKEFETTPSKARVKKFCCSQCQRDYQFSLYEIKIPPLEAAWLAGFVDGEGSIRLTTSKYKATGKRYFVPQIVIANTREDIIDYIRELVGFGYKRHLHWNNPNWSDAYWYSVNGLGALNLIEYLKKHFKLKTELCNLVLRFKEVLPYSEQVAIYERLKALNHRGKKRLL